MKKKFYRIEEEYPEVGDLFEMKVGNRYRTLQFYRKDDKTVYLTDGKKIIRCKPEEVRAIQITPKLLVRMGFYEEGGRLVLDRGGLHFEAYERANTMHIEITPEGSTQKTYVCCDFVHELQHLKRLEIAGITLPFNLRDEIK